MIKLLSWIHEIYRKILLNKFNSSIEYLKQNKTYHDHLHYNRYHIQHKFNSFFLITSRFKSYVQGLVLICIFKQKQNLPFLMVKEISIFLKIVFKNEQKFRKLNSVCKLKNHQRWRYSTAELMKDLVHMNKSKDLNIEKI